MPEIMVASEIEERWVKVVGASMAEETRGVASQISFLKLAFEGLYQFPKLTL